MPLLQYLRFFALLALLGFTRLAQPQLAQASPAQASPANDQPVSAPSPPRTQIFYYPWYGTPAADGRWVHWQQNNHRPPSGISSNYQPLLGPYSSNSPAVVDQHMAWIAQAGIDVVVTSWWGRDSFEDRAVQGLLDAASRHGLRVAFHIEPYVGRTAESVRNDFAYLYRSYGGHPAFLRVSRPTATGPSAAPRGVFYVYESLAIPDAQWRAVLDGIRNTPLDAFVLGQTSDVRSLQDGHFDGLYTYDVFNPDGSSFKAINDAVISRGGVFAPSVGPGYVDQRAVGSSRTKPRQNGDVYDAMWRRAIDSGAEWITVTSFNEWHEGTQIEPAAAAPVQGTLSYEGSYGLSGTAAEMAYVNRTHAMTDAFAAARAPLLVAALAPSEALPVATQLQTAEVTTAVPIVADQPPQPTDLTSTRLDPEIGP